MHVWKLIGESESVGKIWALQYVVVYTDGKQRKWIPTSHYTQKLIPDGLRS